MTIISTIINALTYDLRATIISLLIGIIAYYLTKFYLKIKSLPPGPLPLPIIGNLFQIYGKEKHPALKIIDFSKTYGSVLTLWFGPTPVVIILDRDIARDAFRRNETAGRPDSFFGTQFSNKLYTDVIFADYGHTWEALRRVAHSAVRKYAVSEKLENLVSDVVDDTMQIIKSNEGLNHLFSPFDYIFYLFLNILAASVFGKRYNFEDQEFKKIIYSMRDSRKEFVNRLMIWEFIPISRIIDRKLVKKQKKVFRDLIDLIRNKYINHYNDYNETVIRDFSDALICAKNEALAEEKESATHLTDDNLAMVCLDLFFAGIDTSQFTFRWLLMLMCYYPETQQKLRQEIKSQIGDRIPTNEDRNRCHYVNAFISETLRFRNIVPIGVFHKTVAQTEIGGFTIPNGTTVNVHQYSICNDQKYWSKPDQFIPERFIENGKYLTTRPTAFIPFGVGRRVCLGERLALADLFLVFVRFLQSTDGYTIELENGPNEWNLDPKLDSPDNILPNDYRILLKT